jgi:hypothetical protein
LFVNPLTSELNFSAQRCMTRFLLGILLLVPCFPLKYAWKINKYTIYSFSLLIMYSSSYIFSALHCHPQRAFLVPFEGLLVVWCVAISDHHAPHHETQHALPQHSIHHSSIEHLSQGNRNAPWGW